MPEFALAQAFVRIRPDLTGFKVETDAKLKAALLGLRPNVPVGVDTKAVLLKVEAVKKLLNTLTSRTYEAKVVARDADTHARLARISNTLVKIDKIVAQPEIDMEGLPGLEAQLLAVAAQLGKIDKTVAVAHVDVEADDGLARIALLRVKMRALTERLYSLQVAAPTEKAQKSVGKLMDRMHLLQRTMEDLNASAASGRDPISGRFESASQAAARLAPRMASVEREMRKIGVAADSAVPATDRLRRRFYGLFSALIYGEVRLFAFGKTALATIAVWHLVFDIVLEFVAILIPAAVALGAFAIAGAQAAEKVYNHFLNLHTVFDATGQALPPMTQKFHELQAAIQPHVYQLLGDALTVLNQKSGTFNKVAMDTAHVIDNLGARFAIAITSGEGTNRIMSEATEAFRVFSDVVANTGRIIGSVLKALPGFAISLFKVVEALTSAGAAAANFLEPVLAIGLKLHGAIVWIGLATTIVTKLGGKLYDTAIKLAEFAGKSVLIVNAMRVVRGEVTLTTAAMETLRAVSMKVWIGLGIAAIAGLVLWMTRMRNESDKLNASLQDMINNADISKLSATITQAQVTTLRELTRRTNELSKSYGNATEASDHLSRGGGAVSAAFLNQKANIETLNKSLQNYYEQGNLVRGRVNALARAYGGQEAALGLLNAAGVTAQEMLDKSPAGWALLAQKVSAVEQGYRAMGQTGSTLANDLQVLDKQVDPQIVAMQKLNQAWDQFIQTVVGSQQAFDTFELGMVTLNKNFEKASKGANTTTHHLGELKIKADVTHASIDDLTQSGLALNQAFAEQIVNGNALIDTIRTAGLSNRDLRVAVASIISPMTKYAKGSQQATAQLVALAQEAGYKGPVSMQALTKWLDRTRHSTKALKDIVNEATIQEALLTGAMKGQADFMANQLKKQLDMAILKYGNLTEDIDNYAKAIANSGKTSDAAQAARNRLINDLIKTGRHAGLSDEAIAGMIHRVTGIPTKKALTIVETGLGNFSIHGPPGTASALKRINRGLFPVGGLAGGGFVPGAGDTDSVPAMLTPGEVVIPKRMVQSGAVDHLKGSLPGFSQGGRVGYADGGTVNAVPNAPREKRSPDGGFIQKGDLDVLSGKSATRFDNANLFALTSTMEKDMTGVLALVMAAMGGGYRIAQFARKFATGNNHPYVWGGTSPSGWDCSGFTSFVYRHFGYGDIPRTSEAQFAWGDEARDQPGALVFFRAPQGGPPPGHVGISMGTGMMANANSVGVGTIMSSTAGNMGFRIPRGGFGAGGGGRRSFRENQLGSLWIQAGGPPNLAHLMSAIAMAESGGRSRAHNPSGATGLWQIMPSSQIIRGNLYNPLVNAKNAVAIWAQQGLGAWSAYTNGAYRQFMADGGLVQKLDQGGFIPPGVSMVQNDTGEPEEVIPMQRGGRARRRHHHHTLSHDVDRALDIIRHHPFAIDRQNRLLGMLHHVQQRIHTERALLGATHGRQRHRLLARLHHDEHRRHHLHRLLRPVQHEMHIVNVAENHLHRRVAALTRQINAAHRLHLTGLEHHLRDRRSFRRRQIREMQNWELIPRTSVLERSTRREAHAIIDSVLKDMGLPHISYDKGGFLPPGLSLAANQTGRPERVGAGEQKIVVEFRGGHSNYGQFLTSEIQRLAQIKGGGDVQLAFGSSR